MSEGSQLPLTSSYNVGSLSLAIAQHFVFFLNYNLVDYIPPLGHLSLQRKARI